MQNNTNQIPAGFAYLDDPRLIYSMNYLTTDNFIGRPIAGYKNKVCILTTPAIAALTKVQDALDKMQKNYVLKIFDTYRPTSAVTDFVTWAQDPTDLIGQPKYYPGFTKAELFELNYLATKSSHSRGSTVDLTIAIMDPLDSSKHNEVDFGTIFDFFGTASHTVSTEISLQAQANRKMFLQLMQEHGFENFPQEWWHFTLQNEPYPDTYFDFVVA